MIKSLSHYIYNYVLYQVKNKKLKKLKNKTASPSTPTLQ